MSKTKKTAKPETKASKRAPKPAPEKTKRVSAIDAAAQVLKARGEAMRSNELITAMAEQKRWSSPNGKTPHATLYAAILREIESKGREARFKKVERGKFEFNG